MNECNPIGASHNNHNCDNHATCENAFGTFTCTCNAGWEGNGTSCTNIGESFEMAPVIIYESYLDECATEAHACDTGTTTCVDNTGDVSGYSCSCLDGFFKVNENDKSCHDMNECNPIAPAHPEHNCDTHATCTNTFGSFTCACNIGWEGDAGTSCSNVDECQKNTDQCDTETTTCVDNTGDDFGYQCQCKAGYKYVENKVEAHLSATLHHVKLFSGQLLH